MLRYSLATLFFVLIYVAILCAALVNATGVWPQVAVTMTVVVLLVFTLAAMMRKSAFSAGFAFTGWVYFLLMFTSLFNVRGFLLTDTAVQWLYPKIHPQMDQQSATTKRLGLVQLTTPVQPAPPSNSAYTTFYVTSPPAPTPTPYVDRTTFGNIAHSLWAVILACLGGIVAQVFYVRSQRNKQD